MKKIISISLVLLLASALFRFSIATHYCGGEVVNTKISLSGRSVSCCLQAENINDPVHEALFSSICCEDIFKFIAVDSKFTVTNAIVPKFLQGSSQIFLNPYEISIDFSPLSELTGTGAGPPGHLMSTSVDLSDICVFRI